MSPNTNRPVRCGACAGSGELPPGTRCPTCHGKGCVCAVCASTTESTPHVRAAPGHPVRVKPGTVMLAAPKAGVAQDACFVCTGPDAHDAFVVGMCVGINMLQGGYRPKLCIEHETMFRETLAVMVPIDATLCEKLGIEFKVAGEEP